VITGASVRVGARQRPKLVAGRQKDVEFATALLAHDLISEEILLARARLSCPAFRGSHAE